MTRILSASSTMEQVQEKLAAQPAQQEPFGYFKAEPFGWTDCAETDEGAVALYERPQPAQRKPLPFNKDDMEGLDINQRLGFKLGWKSAEEAHGIKEKNNG